MWFSRYHFPKLRLDGKLVYLRPPQVSDYPAWRQVRAHNRNFLKPWEPTWPLNALTPQGFKQRLRYQSHNWREKRGFAFLIFIKDTDELIGGVNINHVTGGVSKMGSLGYWLAEEHTSKGYMRDAITQIIQFAFFRLDLHRLEAACILGNESSQRVLKHCGFTLEGHVRKYIKIDGRWQDHMLYGIVKEDLENKEKKEPLRLVA